MLSTVRYKPKTKPYPHQARASLRAARARNYALYMEPRLGKSKAALDAAGMLAVKGEVKRVLILAPLTSLSVWEDEIRLHWPRIPGVTFVLLNYDKLSRSRHGKNWVYPRIRLIERWRPDLIICDESHRLKAPGGVRTQALWRSVRRQRKAHTLGRPYVQLLSGTPNPKSLRDLFAQYRIMDDSIFGTNAGDFDEEYVRYGTGKRQWQIVGYNNKKELMGKIRARAYFCTEKQAGADMPPQQWQNVKVELPPKARKAYLQMAEEFIAEVEGGVITASNAGVKALRLRQITGGLLGQRDIVVQHKTRALGEILDDLQSQEQQAVVYARFLPEVDACTEVARKVGMRVAAISGSVEKQARTLQVRRFREGELDVLVFQVQVGSLSLNLATASEVVFYSLPDGWETYFQNTQRVREMGKKTPVRYRHLVCPGTVDMRQIKGLRAKADLQAELFRSPREFLFDL